MAVLPNDIKYRVQTILQEFCATDSFKQALEAQGIDYLSVELLKIDRLNFHIRIRPNGGGAPRYISIRVSESI